MASLAPSGRRTVSTPATPIKFFGQNRSKGMCKIVALKVIMRNFAHGFKPRAKDPASIILQK
jgi:hypothetical protein